MKELMQTQILRFICAVALAVAVCTVATAQESATDGASERWHKRAEQGDVFAQYFLCLAYDDDGNGVLNDDREAARWCRKAALQGHAKGQFELGSAYYFGKGIAEDKSMAVLWWNQSAEQGYMPAQLGLGAVYANGSGADADPRKAVHWYRKAAEQGNEIAQRALGSAYFFGKGVITDVHEAYIWLSISKAGGNESAAEFLHDIDQTPLLTPSEVSSARKEAARRLDAINRRIAEKEQDSSDESDIATKPKDTNIAEQVFENTWRSVVVVRNGDGQGSGVIVRPNVVATNCHVVDAGGKITVYKSDNRRADTDTAFSATIRHSDEDKDFCLLDVDGLWGMPATVRKYDTLGIGEDVYGLGAPQGFDLSLSTGVISQLRELDGNRFIQTDTAISPGSSGGGLFDSDGNLVGITSAKIVKEGAEGIGFAIPADLVLGN